MLQAIQNELKAPKNQYNSFGKYKYRSCEDILEAVKPILVKYSVYLTLSDEVVEIGTRVYVKATATLHGKGLPPMGISVTAFARESETKKGMDDSQITGTASSYARKYALNGIFLIDDTKDADTNEHRAQGNTVDSSKPELISPADVELIQALLDENFITTESFLHKVKLKSIADMKKESLERAKALIANMAKN